ncbi:hypothetical protein B7P43_G11660 [Cryptotermes secundus]|uniref:Transmembrane protein 126A n=1 Tax=Cryptotermes secundus TaxID=105785 RepID=A0A2J7PHE5_9NEOP|nr:uncharacterized protein LOC111873951 isoform X1 [Cryptotermes secundus]XP_023724832.1 uncharacterized protein LOC111873951 isoform X1 [Cryptotermes secundus]XP_023724833.1 uncharacterized protein LOC111873951 isoform X1 [Cryptotermes secundus]PNF15749.1 hypothetical protein B7P43_G11660 [Cryptotermes secundus]
MALHKGRIGEIPQGTIQLTEEEAKEYQYRVIFGWTPQREVWPLHYGYGILGACSALSGMYINNYFRSRLRLHTYGRVSSYLPVIALPALMSALFHQQAVTTGIVLQKTACPLCIQLRASAVQVGFSVIYPTLLSPLVGFTLASYYNSYRLPQITEDFKAVFALWRKFTKPIRSSLFSIAIAQALVAMWITYCEATSYYKIQAKLNMESDVTEELKH